MLLHTLPVLTLLSLSTLILAAEPALHTSTLYHQPLTAATPTPLATIAFHPQHPHLSQLLSLSPPKPPSSAPINPQEITRIAIPVPGRDGAFRTTTADLASLVNGEGRFKIVVTEKGEIVGGSWRGRSGGVGKGGKDGKGDKGGRGDFEMVVQREGIRAVIEKAAPGAKTTKVEGQEGEAGVEVEEKTFLQKYWWLLLAVAVLALSGGGGGGDDKK